MTLHIGWILGLVFGWEMEGFWASVIHRNCSYICELDVRFLNHLNWTSIAQVMVPFLRLSQLRLLNSLCLDFGPRDFGPEFFIELVAAYVNLMLDF